MRIAYNPKTAQALMSAPNNEDITFDLSGLAIYVKGVKFEGKAYSVFKKHTLNTTGGYDGLVPAPSYTETTERYLREDGTWVVPNNTTANLADYVTVNTAQTIKGQKRFTSTVKVEVNGGISLDLVSKDKYSGIAFVCNNDSDTLTKLNGFFLYKGDSNYYLTDSNWMHEYKILHSGNSSIKDGVITINNTSITPLTSHQSLTNYVTLNGDQTITGRKTFNNSIVMGTSRYIYGIDEAGGSMLHFDGERTVIGSSGASTTKSPMIRTNTGDVTINGDKTVLHSKNSYIKNGVITINGSSITPLTVHLSLSNYVTLDGDQTISGIKTFSSQLKFTVAKGTSPFTVSSTTKVDNLNADLLDGLHSTDFVRQYGIVGANFSTGNWLGYTYATEEHGGPVAGGVISAGVSSGMLLVGSHTGTRLYYRGVDDGAFSDWKRVAFTDSDITGNAASADKVNNSLTLKINSGTTEGTDLYTYNGSAAKTLDIKWGTGIKFVNTEGSLQIYNSGVRSISTGTTNGTIRVNTDGTSTNIPVKGLDTAAYINKNLLANYTKGNNYIAFNLYDSSLHSVGLGEGYIEYYDNGAWYNSRWGWVEAVNGFKGSLTGNASSATKLQTKRKLWGLNFDGSADVSGDMTGVGSIIRSEKNAVNTDSLGNLKFKESDVFQTWSIQNHNSVAQFVVGENGNTTVTGFVKAPTFQGNLDGTYVNKLTGYTKATAIAALATTDSLNKALGKLEYKADVVYDLVKGAYDGDGTIENLAEILKVLEGIKDTETIQAIIGKYLPLTGGTLTGSLVVRGASINVRSDKSLLRFLSFEDVTYIESGNSAFNDNAPLKLTGYNGFTGSDLYLLFNHIYCRGGNYTNLDSGNTYINNGTITINGNSITPLTSHQSLNNYVTLNTNQTITGLKTFNNQIIINTTATHKTPKLVFNEYLTSETSWISEIVSDYFGTNICKTEGFTHGLYITLGRSGYDNLNILNSSKTPIARISKEKGHWFDGNMLITGNVGIGVTDPLYPLHVIGNAEINANGNGNSPLIINTPHMGYSGFVHFKAEEATIGKIGFFNYTPTIQDKNGNRTTILHSGNYTSYVNTTNFPGLNSIGDITGVTAGAGLSGGGTSGSVTLTNAGVRSVTINGNYLQVNTNGTNADLTIPYATNTSRLKITALTLNLDLNITTEGVYGTSASNIINSLSNKPSNMIGGECRLEVLHCNSSNYFLLLLYALGDKAYKVWHRFYRNGWWSEWIEVLNSSNYSSYLGYIGTTAVQASSAALALTGITNLTMNGTYTNNNKLYINSSGCIYPYSTSTRTAGMYGKYDSTKVGHVWSMGTDYKITDDGSSTNNMYGLVYFHTNWSNDKTRNTATRDGSLITEVSTYAGGHQIAFVVNGQVKVALGDRVWSRAGFLKSGSSDSYVLLGGGGHKKLSDFLLKSEELTNNLTTITKTLVVSKDWVDTGIVFNAATFPNGTGSYIVQLSRDYCYYWTGCLSIVISNNVTLADSDEILLHGGGFDTKDQYYLRTVHDTTNKVVKLQIARNNTYSTSKTYTFKFKKLI